jgi:Anti-sigma-K factor rskA, C-terminal
MNDPQQHAERLRDLLADQALFELSAEEQNELRALLANSNVNPESFEWTAALAAVALNPGPHEPLNAELRAKLAAAAPEHQAAAQLIAESKRVAPASISGERSGLRLREAIAWFAAAACFLIALVHWSGSQPAALPTIAQARDFLLKQDPHATKLDWKATEDPTAKDATGDVVWSNAKQQGYLRFKGLAKNDPKLNQYQLWIFDAKQDKRYPIDGGVFDVDPTTGDVIVPIHAKLHVVDPKMFAVTVEKPGGVVVSSRDRIALLAKTDG